jgi:hypothetical protein
MHHSKDITSQNANTREWRNAIHQADLQVLTGFRMEIEHLFGDHCMAPGDTVPISLHVAL